MQEKIHVLEREQISESQIKLKTHYTKSSVKCSVLELATFAECELYDGNTEAIEAIQEMVELLKNLLTFTENKCVAMQERARKIKDE